MTQKSGANPAKVIFFKQHSRIKVHKKNKGILWDKEKGAVYT